jgi:hypothetical protein
VIGYLLLAGNHQAVCFINAHFYGFSLRASSALEGADFLADINKRINGRLSVIAAAGVNSTNVHDIILKAKVYLE